MDGYRGWFEGCCKGRGSLIGPTDLTISTSELVSEKQLTKGETRMLKECAKIIDDAYHF